MKIGIDIDNVIANTYQDLYPFFNKFMGRDVRSEDVVAIMRKERWRMLQYFVKAWRNKIMTTVSVAEGAAETIKSWYKEHHINLVTSRYKLFNRQTKEWLKKYQIPYHELHHTKEGTKYKKAPGCDIFIEDNLKECEILANHCQKVLLFNYPWNRKPINKENIVRVNNWSEIKNFFNRFKTN